MTEQWTVVLLEGPTQWSDDWTPEMKQVEIDGDLLREIIELDAGDPGLFRTLVEMFRHDTDVHLPVLKRAAREGDVSSLTNLSHSLAGEAAQIGASSVAVHCRGIETAALRADFSLTERLVDALVDHLEQFVNAVERELWGGDLRGSSTPPPSDPTA